MPQRTIRAGCPSLVDRRVSPGTCPSDRSRAAHNRQPHSDRDLDRHQPTARSGVEVEAAARDPRTVRGRHPRRHRAPAAVDADACSSRESGEVSGRLSAMSCEDGAAPRRADDANDEDEDSSRQHPDGCRTRFTTPPHGEAPAGSTAATARSCRVIAGSHDASGWTASRAVAVTSAPLRASDIDAPCAVWSAIRCAAAGSPRAAARAASRAASWSRTRSPATVTADTPTAISRTSTGKQTASSAVTMPPSRRGRSDRRRGRSDRMQRRLNDRCQRRRDGVAAHDLVEHGGERHRGDRADRIFRCRHACIKARDKSATEAMKEPNDVEK